MQSVGIRPAKLVAWVTASAVAVLFVPRLAVADIGFPMLAAMWPVAWLTLPPAIVIEAVVARRVLGFSWGRAFRLSTIANLLSTALGVPLTWIVLGLPLWLIGAVAFTPGADSSPWAIVFVVPLYAFWLPPLDRAHVWVIPAVGILLCVPFYFATTWVEFRIARFYVESSPLARRWSRAANAITYALMISFLALCVILALAGLV